MAAIASSGLGQADIDELFDVPPVDPVHVGLECLESARVDARRSHPDVIAMLVVPLPASIDLVVDSPDFAEVVSAPWVYGPGLEVVGLYLLEPRVLASYEPAEEYRCHATPAPSGAAPRWRC